MRSFHCCTFSSAFIPLVLAGFPPHPRETATIDVPGWPGASLSFKETSICESNSKGYAGYVHMPSTTFETAAEVSPYNTSLFFWYFEARNDPRNAQTAIYLAGGPGISSMASATQSGGPCTVLSDANGTVNNPWAWNEHVNMLYIDQPVGAGFSYDTLVNGTRDLLYAGGGSESSDIVQLRDSLPKENTTTLLGTFSSQDGAHSANTTATTARTLWYFAQMWFTSFPHYDTADKGVSIWGNSYGGYYVPYSAALFQQQNVRIQAGELKALTLPLNTAGWTNGCTDMLYQAEWYPEAANNNTYGLQLLPDEVYAAAKQAWSTEGGCRDRILACREAGDIYDPDMYGNNETVNELCLAASYFCASQIVLRPFDEHTNRSAYDLSHFNPDPSPPYYSSGFFNRRWVQRELGVPLNFTRSSPVVSNNFLYTGDAFRAEGVKRIEYLLDQGIHIAMIYGDRDYRCPWNGAEKLSLAGNWSASGAFRSAGYADIKVGDCGSSGGVVRQHGNLSFSRVFQAGHDPAYSQPRTVFEIFTRSMLGFDVASGKQRVREAYSTTGPKDSRHVREILPEAPPVECSIYAVADSCMPEQYLALQDGMAVIVNTTVVEPEGEASGGLTGTI